MYVAAKRYTALESHETSTVFSGIRFQFSVLRFVFVLFCFVCLRPVSCVPMLSVSLDCPFFVLFVFVLCLVCPMLSVSLGCPFLAAPSVFSKAYFNFKYKMSWKIFPCRRLLMLKCLYQARKVNGHVYVCNVIDLVKHTPLSSLLMTVAMTAAT